ncbi:MAG: shikimate kinase [bacterium]|nr:shikimate kinase [bacterium]
MNLIFLGFMGAGKTAIGKRLALRLGYQFLDTDAWVEAKEKRTIKEIFATDGEAYFRRLETECLGRLKAVTNHVVATGGGILSTPGNLELIKSLGTSIFIDADFQNILERVQRNDKRPLAQGEGAEERLAKLYAERRPLYEQADLIFKPQGTQFPAIINQLIRML